MYGNLFFRLQNGEGWIILFFRGGTILILANNILILSLRRGTNVYCFMISLTPKSKGQIDFFDRRVVSHRGILSNSAPRTDGLRKVGQIGPDQVRNVPMFDQNAFRLSSRSGSVNNVGEAVLRYAIHGVDGIIFCPLRLFPILVHNNRYTVVLNAALQTTV